MDWQDIWQDLEDVYDKAREKKGDGTTIDDRIIDCLLAAIECGQSVCESMGAVPVEPCDCPEHESSDQCHSPEDHVGPGPCRCVYSED